MSFGTILGAGNWMKVHRIDPMRLEAIRKTRLTWEDSLPAAAFDWKAEAETLRGNGPRRRSGVAKG